MLRSGTIFWAPITSMTWTSSDTIGPSWLPLAEAITRDPSTVTGGAVPRPPVGRGRELAHLTPLHLAVHLVKAWAKRLVQPRTLDVLGEACEFQSTRRLLNTSAPGRMESTALLAVFTGVHCDRSDSVVFQSRVGRR